MSRTRRRVHQEVCNHYTKSLFPIPTFLQRGCLEPFSTDIHKKSLRETRHCQRRQSFLFIISRIFSRIDVFSLVSSLVSSTFLLFPSLKTPAYSTHATVQIRFSITTLLLSSSLLFQIVSVHDSTRSGRREWGVLNLDPNIW